MDWLNAWLPPLPRIFRTCIRALEHVAKYINPMKFFAAMGVSCTGANAPIIMLVNLLMVFGLIVLFDSGMSASSAPPEFRLTD